MTPLIHLILLLLAWLICQPLPQKAVPAILTAFGVIAVTLFAPVASAVILLTVIQAGIMVIFFSRLERRSSLRKWGPYIIFLNLLFVDFHESILGLPVATLAISFSVIRIFMTTRQLLSSRKGLQRTDVVWILAAAFYLPAVVIGPVFSGMELQKQYRTGHPPEPELRDARMVFQGLVLALLVATAFSYGAIVTSTFSYPGNQFSSIVTPVFLFISLFAAFWGQSLIAEHTSRFFGIKLPVNFDHPWKARSIKDFWQRWHRSMAEFVLQYIYLPLSLRGFSPKLATIIAFTFMGVWHNVSFGYLVWGVAHGTLLAYAPIPGPSRSQQIASRALLWVVVIFLSWFANYGPWS